METSESALFRIRRIISGKLMFTHGLRVAYADLKLMIDRVRNYPSLKKLFYKRVKYPLDLNAPQSYNQKIIWKKLYDRNPLLTITADKYAVRKYVENILGEEDAERILIPLIKTGRNFKDIDFDSLPDKFVFKANHGSKMNYMVRGKNDEHRQTIRLLAREWMNSSYGLFHYEWAYRHIKPLLIVEKLIETADGHLPRDYKFYCFHGECHLIRVSQNRFHNCESSGYYDVKWNFLPVFNPGYPPDGDIFKKPGNHDEMVSLACYLSRDFDAVRIDLYSADDRIYFSEFTHYDASGMARFEPESFDFELGALWKLEPEYWMKKSEIRQYSIL